MTLTELRDKCAFCLRAWQRFWPMRWTLMLGFAGGAALSFVTPLTWYDELVPVVTMRAEVVQLAPTELLVSLSGKKNRDCKYEGISAYAQLGAVLKELSIARADRPASDTTHPQGVFSFGTWRIWPTANTKLVALYVLYDCAGRQVHVRAATIQL